AVVATRITSDREFVGTGAVDHDISAEIRKRSGQLDRAFTGARIAVRLAGRNTEIDRVRAGDSIRALDRRPQSALLARGSGLNVATRVGIKRVAVTGGVDGDGKTRRLDINLRRSEFFRRSRDQRGQG